MHFYHSEIQSTIVKMFSLTVVLSVYSVIVSSVTSYSLTSYDGKNYYFTPDIQPVKLQQKPKEGPFKFVTSKDYKDDDVGYSHGTHEKGQDGYHHVEKFHKKDGDDYENEKHEGYGESKSDGNYREVKPEKYEVTESHKEKSTPKPVKYGFLKPDWVKKQTKKGVPIEKKDFNGYETVVYHENHKGNTDNGYKNGRSYNLPAQSYEYSASTEQNDDNSGEGADTSAQYDDEGIATRQNNDEYSYEEDTDGGEDYYDQDKYEGNGDGDDDVQNEEESYNESYNY